MSPYARAAGSLPRFLTSADPVRLPSTSAPVVVLGSGVAGLRAALAAAESTDVLLLAKRRLVDTNTNAAQGGVAAAIGRSDSPELHREDTWTAGGAFGDRGMIDRIVREAPAAIDELATRFGCVFDRAADAGVALTREGGHSESRILHASGDATGREIQRALTVAVREHPRITIREQWFALDLVRADGTDPNAPVTGVIAADPAGALHMIRTQAVVLATGGAGQLFRETTNPPVATGDGLAIALRAGAELRDLEFVQFHPTVLYIAGAPRVLISEAVRGEGAWLVNESGERVMQGIHPDMELAPRDVVARAIVRALREEHATQVYLDLSHLTRIDPAVRFPTITKVCATFSLDLRCDRIPVRPAAHYMIGGVTAPDGFTSSIPGLLVAGEVSSTGLHGANRLGSNSLLEGLVCGRWAGEAAAKVGAIAAAGEFEAPEASDLTDTDADAAAIDAGDARSAVRALMERDLGVERNGPDLRAAIERLRHWANYLLAARFTRPAGWELQNMLTVAAAVAHGELQREETRGAHARTDFPDASPAWNRHQTLTREDFRAIGTPGFVSLS
jgi:L-aspartate oxidase